MGYELEPEIRQSDGDDYTLYPVFCTTELSSEDIKTLILETRVDPETWQSSFLLLDTLNSTPEALASTKHATRYPCPPLTSPFSNSWTPVDFYNFYNLHLRGKDKFSSFAFLIISAETLASPEHIITVCTDSPDYFENGEIYLKQQKMPWKEVVQVVDCYELCIQCISEYGLDMVMSQQPPASMNVTENTDTGFIGTVAEGSQLRRNRLGAIKAWERMLEEDGKADEARARSEACRCT